MTKAVARKRGNGFCLLAGFSGSRANTFLEAVWFGFWWMGI
jgi:hypothetical protein